jgi:TRAP-type C4-dicarboxylate transport system substrate-binding protein
MQKTLKVNEVDKDAFVNASKSVYEDFAKEVKGGKELVDRVLALR